MKNKMTDCLNAEDVAILKKARKILQRIQKKYDRWDNKIYNMEGWEGTDECRKMDEWIDYLYDKVKIDFSGSEVMLEL